MNRPDSLLVRMRSALNKVDVVVTSGGVSMGEKVLIALTEYSKPELCVGGINYASA